MHDGPFIRRQDLQHPTDDDVQQDEPMFQWRASTQRFLETRGKSDETDLSSIRQYPTDDEFVPTVQYEYDDFTFQWDNTQRSIETTALSERANNETAIEDQPTTTVDNTTLQMVGMSLAIAILLFGLFWVILQSCKIIHEIRVKNSHEKDEETAGERHCTPVQTTVRNDRREKESNPSGDDWSIDRMSTLTTSIPEDEGGVESYPDQIEVIHRDSYKASADHEPHETKAFAPFTLSHTLDGKSPASWFYMNDLSEAYVRPVYFALSPQDMDLGIDFADASCDATHATVKHVDPNTSLTKRISRHDIILAVNDDDATGWSAEDVQTAIKNTAITEANSSSGSLPQIIKLTVMTSQMEIVDNAALVEI